MNYQQPADLSLLRPMSQPTTTTAAKADYGVKNSKRGTAIGIVALVMSIIAIVLVIILVIVWAVNRNNDTRNPGWRIVMGRSTGGSGNRESFRPDGNDIFVVGATDTLMDLNILRPGGNLTGRVFMVDNTGNAKSCRAGSNDVRIIDGFGNGYINSRSTGTYIWTNPNTIRRLY